VKLLGIHHITAIAGDRSAISISTPRCSSAFGSARSISTTRLRITFTFGDRIGTPGTVITFFPWPERATRHARQQSGCRRQFRHSAGIAQSLERLFEGT